LDTRHRTTDTCNIEHKTQKESHGQHWTQDTERQIRVTLDNLSFCVLCPMLHVSFFLCLVSNVTRVYLSLFCVQCCPCLSFCVLCPMLPCLSFCVLYPMLPVSIFLCLVSNVTRVYLSVSCAKCYPSLIFCVLYPMLPVSIFLCFLSNVTRVFLSASCVQFYPYLSLCVLCPMLHVSIFLCLVSNVTRVYLSALYFYDCSGICGRFSVWPLFLRLSGYMWEIMGLTVKPIISHIYLDSRRNKGQTHNLPHIPGQS
jgi:hypothetical protein